MRRVAVWLSLADAPLEERRITLALDLRDANAVAELANRARRVAAAAHAAHRRHAGIVPAVDDLLVHHLEEKPLRHHRVRQIEARKLALLRADLDAVPDRQEALLVHAVDDPIIERTMHLELQGAH